MLLLLLLLQGNPLHKKETNKRTKNKEQRTKELIVCFQLYCNAVVLGNHSFCFLCLQLFCFVYCFVFVFVFVFVYCFCLLFRFVVCFALDHGKVNVCQIQCGGGQLTQIRDGVHVWIDVYVESRWGLRRSGFQGT